MYNQLILTRVGEVDLQARFHDGVLESMSCFPFFEPSQTGRIVVGKVKNIKRSIEAAFIEFQDGTIGFYDLKKQPLPILTNRMEDGRLLEGDEVIVQIEREASRNKIPLLTGKYSLTGKYVVLTRGNNHLSISSHWKNTPEGEKAREILAPYQNDEFGLILRTNAKDLPSELLKSEIDKKIAEYQQFKEQARFRTCFSILWQPVPSYIEEIRDRKKEFTITTDIPEVFASLQAYAKEEEPELLPEIYRYHDNFPLAKLHSLESKLEEHLQKKMWMKSGGFLTFEQTEAMVVIDVNSGKGGNKNKDSEENYFQLNLEAAKMIAKELSIRNLSGIILVDFVDMKIEEHKEALLRTFRSYCKNDPVRTEVIDMTKLGLVELTRKKVKKPLSEQVKYFKKPVDKEV